MDKSQGEAPVANGHFVGDGGEYLGADGDIANADGGYAES